MYTNVSTIENKLTTVSPISDLGLPAKIENCLKRANVITVGDLLKFNKKNKPKGVTCLRNCGFKAKEEVESALSRFQIEYIPEETEQETEQEIKQAYNVLDYAPTAAFSDNLYELDLPVGAAFDLMVNGIKTIDAALRYIWMKGLEWKSIYTVSEDADKLEAALNKAGYVLPEEEDIDILGIKTGDMPLSNRATLCLLKAGIENVGMLVNYIRGNGKRWANTLHRCGITTEVEIVKMLNDMKCGYLACYWLSEEEMQKLISKPTKEISVRDMNPAELVGELSAIEDTLTGICASDVPDASILTSKQLELLNVCVAMTKFMLTN